MSVTIRQARGGKAWEYSIVFSWPDGTKFRERRNAPVTAKSAALRWAQQRESALLTAGPSAPRAKATQTLAAFWPTVVRDHYQANRKKPSTIDAAERIFRRHLAELAPKPLDQITNADVAALKGRLANAAPKTVNNVLSVLSRILSCAVDWGFLKEEPCRTQWIATAPVDTFDWYEPHDFRRLVDGATRVGTDALVFVLLAGSAGLRRGEICALKWHHLDFTRRTINVTDGAWREHEHTTKGGRARLVPMSAELHAALKAARHLRGDYVLGGAERLSNRGALLLLQSAQRRAGLEVNAKIHALRHTFCSHLAIAGAPSKAIQELAGHKDLSTTMRYMHLSPANRADAVGMLAKLYAEEKMHAAVNT